MRAVIAVFAILLVSHYVAGQIMPKAIEFNGAWPKGQAGNSAIWYQTGEFLTFKNIKNPIQVGITYPFGTENTEANICLNSNAVGVPVSGVNLESICPTGGFGYAANTTEVDFSANKVLLRQLLASDEFEAESSYYANVHVKPSIDSAGFIVQLPDLVNKTQDFFVVISGVECELGYYPVSSDGSCVEIETISLGSVEFNLPQSGWAYYRYNVTKYDPTAVNSLVFSVNGSDHGAKLYLQSGYYPTANWYLNLDGDDDDGTHSTTVLNPATTTASEEIFIAIYNDGDESLPLNLTVSVGTCAASLFGYKCLHNSANATSPIGGYLPLSATVSSTNVTEEGHVYSYDYSSDDYDFDYAYFTLTDLPTNKTWAQLPTPYYVRVTVASNDVRKDAPGFYAKRGAFPSAQSNHYNVSTEGDVSHQIVLRIDESDLTNLSPENTWHFAVKLPSDFSIWVGFNCANDCDNQEHGVCYCNGVACSNSTSGFEDALPFYQRPINTLDSAGACTCSDDDYDDSFDCSQRKNPYLWIWVVAVVLAAVIIIFVLIAVPVFCVVQHKRKSAYSSIEDGGDH